MGKLISILTLMLLLILPMHMLAQTKVVTEAKPYKVFTNGRQVTLKSTQLLSSLMIWTATGHRIVEQKDIKAIDYTCSIPVNAKIVFLMIKLVNGKVYTEKIGL